ncbi:AMP-binding protein [Novosphingobium sp. ERN07]|uniref:AMP-binding protein n=1 Tax=Novosphingobium sp. ERN07 TaxID=2726187 RepID=UPI001456C79E|nr:AMP-binding protein [Novosphingobium sp. ERN07]NLR73499.1 AMP-binding protein [Novosphingobium sp. ERN07]
MSKVNKGGHIISGERIRTFEAIRDRAACIAVGLIETIGSGATVSVMLRNDFAFFELIEATGYAGCQLVPLNWHYTGDEARYIIEDSEARLLVVHADLFRRVSAAIPTGVQVLVLETPVEIRVAYGISDEDAAIPADLKSYEEWADQWTARSLPPGIPTIPTLYTSGTTGRPKGVRRLPSSAAQFELMMGLTARMFGMFEQTFGNGGDPVTTVIATPMYHGAPGAQARLAWLANAKIILQPRFDAEDFLRLVDLHRVTHQYLPPIMFVRLLALSPSIRSRYNLKSLTWIMHTSAPCSPSIKRAMIEWLGPIVHEYYASSETLPSAFITAAEWLERPGSVGRPPAGVTVRIYDETGAILPPGTVGEIYAGHPDMPDFEYKGDPLKRAGAERDGLITAGDIGYQDEEGYLYLSDRKSDMVISGGVNIYPAEIEAEIARIDEVADSAVFGIPNSEYGEALIAIVELKQGVTLDATQVHTALSQRLAKYKIPSVIEFRSDLPRDASGKLRKRILRDPYWIDSERKI